VRLKAFAAVVLAAVLIWSPGPVFASEANALWESYPCPSGSLMADQSTGVPGQYVAIPGVLDCGVPQPGPRFAVAVFEVGAATGYIHGGLVADYASPTGPTTFTVYGDIWDGTSAADAGVCLLTDEHTRLSCVRVSRNLVVTPMPTSDSLVTKEIRPKGGGSTPNCGVCWRLF
jgi:hypothetical protein